jgi:hypothetical protein
MCRSRKALIFHASLASSASMIVSTVINSLVRSFSDSRSQILSSRLSTTSVWGSSYETPHSRNFGLNRARSRCRGFVSAIRLGDSKSPNVSQSDRFLSCACQILQFRVGQTGPLKPGVGPGRGRLGSALRLLGLSVPRWTAVEACPCNWGARGPGFKSRRPDQKTLLQSILLLPLRGSSASRLCSKICLKSISSPSVCSKFPARSPAGPAWPAPRASSRALPTRGPRPSLARS